jgi:hypothetical protein
MPATVISPSWPKGAATRRTEQQARYQKVLGAIAERRAAGEKTVLVNISDLEALICIAAHTDRAIAS